MHDETTIILLTKFFLRNYEIVKQFKNFLRNFRGVIDPAETISAGSLTPPTPKRLFDPAEISNRRFGPTVFFLKGISRIKPAETNFDDFRSDYLGGYEALCETALARESGL
jgi:hypothetical protein